MFQQGFQVEATDAVSEIARKAEKHIRRPVRVMRFDELNEIKVYDAVWAHANLLHVPHTALPEVPKRIFRALRPGGLAVIGSGATSTISPHPSRRKSISISAPSEIISTDGYIGGGYEGGQGPWAPLRCENHSDRSAATPAGQFPQ